MCWCGSSGSFTEILLSKETCVGVGAEVYSRSCYLKKICVRVGVLVHFRGCYYLRKRVMVWEQWITSRAAIISGYICWCGCSS
jgi:hypothetical protein